MEIVIFRYSPLTIELYKLKRERIIIAPESQKKNYEAMKSTYGFDFSVYFVVEMNLQNVIKILDDINKKSKIVKITSLSEEDLDWVGLLNDTYAEVNSSFSNNSLFKNKYYMRSFLQGIVMQPSFIMPETTEDMLSFLTSDKEYVFKPIKSDGSRGILFIDRQYVIDNSKLLDDILKTKSYLVEEKIESNQMISCDGYAFNKKIKRLFVHDYNDLITNCLSVNSYSSVTTSVLYENQDTIWRIEEECQKIIDRIGMKNELTPFHFEWFICKEDLVFCEVAKRFGGVNIPQLINESYDLDILNEYWNEDLANCFDIVMPKRISCGFLAYAKKGKIKEVPSLPAYFKGFVKLYKCFVKEGDFCNDSTDTSNQLFSCIFLSKNHENYLKNLNILLKFKDNFVYE